MKICRMVALWALLGCGCRAGCTPAQGPGGILQLAGAATPAALWLPDVAATADHGLGFLGHATQKSGGAAVRRLRDGIIKQVGFDPLVKDDYAKAGINPAAGLLIFLEETAGEPLLALGVSDPSRFDAAVKDFMARTDGADTTQITSHQGWQVITLGRPFGSEIAPALHWVHVGQFVLIARADGLATLERALDRLATKPSAPNLGQDATFSQLQGRVPAGDVLAFARPKAFTAGDPNSGAVMITSGQANAQGFQSDTLVTFAPQDRPDFMAALGQAPVLPLAARIDNDAALVFMTAAARPEGVQALRNYPSLGGFLDRALTPLTKSVGVSIETDVLPLLRGPLTAGVHLANVADLPQKLKEARGPQALLDAVHVAVVAELTNPEAMLQLLEKSRLALAKQGVALRRRSDKLGTQTCTLFEPDGPAPKLGWGVYGKYYVYAAGTGRLQQTLQRLSQGDSDLPQVLKPGVGGALAQKPGSVLVVRGGALADAAQTVNADDVGTRVGVGALLGSAIELTRTLGDVGVSLSGEPDGLRLQVRELLH